MNKLATMRPWEGLPFFIQDWFRGREEKYREAYKNCPLEVSSETYARGARCYFLKLKENDFEALAVPIDYVTLQDEPEVQPEEKPAEEKPLIIPLVVPRKIKRRIR